MKKNCLNIGLLALLALGGCQSERTEFPAGEGQGTVSVQCEVSDEVLSRAAVAITVPGKSDFSLSIRGVDVTYEQNWTKFTDFVSADNRLAAGNYTASVAWGDPTQEGINKPAYAGSTDFRIKPQEVTKAFITARMVNAQILVTCTEAFKNYFHDETFTLATAAGHTFDFTAASEDAVFIAPGTYTLSGRALKQTGTEVTFAEQRGTAEARTRYTYRFDLSTAGSAKVTVSLDDTVVDEIDIPAELNPES